MRDGFVKHIYYKIIGKGDPLVMIAGLAADHSSWTPLVNHLSDRHKIILFDNRGIGKSSVPDDGDCTIGKMSADVLMLLNELNIEKSNIVGHSLGGYVAQEFSSKYPEKVDKLALLSSKTRTQAVQNLYIETALSMMKSEIPRELIIKNSLCWLFSDSYLSNPQNIVNSINFSMQKPLEESRRSYFYQVNAALNFDTTHSANKIALPTLIVTGEKDILVTMQDAKHLNESIKNSKLKIIKDMAHLSHIEVPEKVAQILQNFFVSPTNLRVA